MYLTVDISYVSEFQAALLIAIEIHTSRIRLNHRAAPVPPVLALSRFSYPRDLESRSIRANRYRASRVLGSARGTRLIEFGPLTVIFHANEKRNGRGRAGVCGPARSSRRRLAPRAPLIPPSPSLVSPSGARVSSSSTISFPLSRFTRRTHSYTRPCMCLPPRARLLGCRVTC